MADSTRRDTILVVDDTPETLGLLTDTLDHAGFTVLIATDGQSALELLDQITPDLVLMDAVMPGMSGFESCRRMKQEKMLSNLPVIFLTGLSESSHVVEGLASGGVDYVTKPIVVDELLARIRVHLTNARAAQGRELRSMRLAISCSPRTVRVAFSGARPRPNSFSPTRRFRGHLGAARPPSTADCRTRSVRAADRATSDRDCGGECHRAGRVAVSAHGRRRRRSRKKCCRSRSRSARGSLRCCSGSAGASRIGRLGRFSPSAPGRWISIWRRFTPSWGWPIGRPRLHGR